VDFDVFPRHLEFYSNSPREAEAADDVANSGVFSNGRANVHAGDGVFATNYALPGYAQRENLMGRSEVIDRQTGDQIEVYVGGATSAMQYMPSTAPRYPWPDRDGYVGGAINKALMDDRGRYKTVDISDMPADFLGPVTDSVDSTDLWRRAVDHKAVRGAPRALSGFLDDVNPMVKVAGALALGIAVGFAARKVVG